MAKSMPGRLDVNLATRTQLTELVGVGAALADAICAARPFGALDDLVAIRGIGVRNVRELRKQGLATTAELAAAGEVPTVSKEADVEHAREMDPSGATERMPGEPDGPPGEMPDGPMDLDLEMVGPSPDMSGAIAAMAALPGFAQQAETDGSMGELAGDMDDTMEPAFGGRETDMTAADFRAMWDPTAMSSGASDGMEAAAVDRATAAPIELALMPGERGAPTALPGDPDRRDGTAELTGRFRLTLAF